MNASSRTGKVEGDPSTGLTFRGADPNRKVYSVFRGTYKPNGVIQWGIAFDLEWNGPQPGDYLAVSAGGKSKFFDLIYTILALDGQSSPNGKTAIAINSAVSQNEAEITIYFLASPDFSDDVVKISNFRMIEVTEPKASFDEPPSSLRVEVNS